MLENKKVIIFDLDGTLIDSIGIWNEIDKKLIEKIGGKEDNEVFIGRDLAHTRSHSEAVASEIDMEIKTIVDDCYKKAKKIILDHEKVLHACAELLLEKEKIGREEFEALFE